MATRLYVGNLAYKTTEEQIKEEFTRLFPEVEVPFSLVIDRDSRQSKGFGFAELATPEEAEKAIKELNGLEIDGRKLVVNEARPRSEAPRGGNGGNGGRGGDRGGYRGNNSGGQVWY